MSVNISFICAFLLSVILHFSLLNCILHWVKHTADAQETLEIEISYIPWVNGYFHIFGASCEFMDYSFICVTVEDTKYWLGPTSQGKIDVCSHFLGKWSIIFIRSHKWPTGMQHAHYVFTKTPLIFDASV